MPTEEERRRTDHVVLQLKCSEERPICAQCSKARRECIPSSGITFRHQQNPSMNGDPVSRESLKNFYGYKETFGPDSVWVPIPQVLEFITTNNPYDDDDGGPGNPNVGHVDDGMGHNGMAFDLTRDTSDGDFARQLAQAAYPAYATHGLEALSAVASQDQYNYAPPPPAPMATHDAPPSLSHSASPQQSHETISQSLDSLLNVHATQPPLTSPPNIDPRLHHGDPAQQQQMSQPQQQMQQPLHHEQPIHVRTSSYTPVRPPNLLLSKGTTGGGPAIRDPKLAFLMRDYSEHAGVWMDLFDLGQFFATEVPVLAADCPLLLYSCAALSAKSLSRVADDNYNTSDVDAYITPSQRHSRLRLWPGEHLDAEGWVRKGRENYDVAVSLLRQALAGITTAQSFSLPDDTTAETASVAQSIPLPSPDSDKLVAATAVLCVYEFLDASGAEWSRHLDGAKSLFDVAKERTIPLTRESAIISPSIEGGNSSSSAPPTMHHDTQIHGHNDSLPTLANQVRERLASNTHDLPTPTIPQAPPSKGRTAVFWNFARQDMLSAFINNTSTRLDTSDLTVWASAGLNLNSQGFICPSNPSHPAYDPAAAMSDDTIANALIWLTMKLVNFIAAGDEMPQSILGVRQHSLLAYWHEMEQQFRSWYEGLPPSFRAISIGAADDTTNDSHCQSERWFPRPLCASAMQTYHFARVQLLLNKPHISTGSPFSPGPKASNLDHRSTSTDASFAGSMPGSSLAARHASYALILKQSRFHAREIVAISRGWARDDEACRIHSVQPLWTAGLVLGGSGGEGNSGDGEGEVDDETRLWRREIVALLRGVEADMGWAADYRVRNLEGVWGECGG
ncbi:hypothetical protein Q7P37_006999 [Cladosporium fusiforme]